MWKRKRRGEKLDRRPFVRSTYEITKIRKAIIRIETDGNDVCGALQIRDYMSEISRMRAILWVSIVSYDDAAVALS